ncbi:hypothetical protein [Nocardia sp. NPDC058705]|uniref:hypothetical protein n=1 Tax=Nocardia sp. NPDC058705 TaxID=3346609 RepID=UPI00369D57F8
MLILPPTDPLDSTLYSDWVRHFDPDALTSAEDLVMTLREKFRKTRKPGAFVDDVDWQTEGLPERHRPWLWDMVGHWLSASQGDSRYRTAAISAYGRARAAEREHSLPVHVDYHRENTLLFARAGALPVKEVAAHQRWLSSLGSAQEAHHAFVRLLVALAQGGASLGADLHRRVRASAKAAGLGIEADSEVLRDVLVACTSQKIPDGLLDGAAKVFAQAPPQDVEPLLTVFPETATDGSALLRLLDAVGAIDGLAAGTLDFPDGPAQWISDFFFMYSFVEVPYGGVTAQQMPPELFDLIERIGPRLKESGKPVSMARGRFGHAHLDTELADALLAVGAGVEGPTGSRMQFWGARSRRDLISLAADPVLGPRLESVVHADSRTTTTAIVRLPDNPGIERSVFTRIVALIERVASGGLLDAETALAELDGLLDLPTVQALDGIEEALAALDGIDPLLRTLRAGIPSEFHWPAWEAAISELDGAQGVTATWPMLTLYNRNRAVVIDPHAAVAETEFTISTRKHLRAVFYAGGDFLVGYSDTETFHPNRAFWTSAPDEKFTPTDSYGMVACRSNTYDGLGYQFATPDGRHDGQRILRSGDRHGVADRRYQLSDGAQVWGFDGRATWAELDPSSGAPAESFSLPAFFTERSLPADKEISSRSLSYVSLPQGVTSSPLGSVAGVSGFRIMSDRNDWAGWVLESVDGRRATFTGGRGIGDPWGLVRFPERDSDLIMTCGSSAGATGFGPIRAHDGDSALWDVGTEPRDRGAFPPPAFWHFLIPRDPAGSTALRELDAVGARALLADAVMPSGITAPPLVDGVRAQADRAAQLVATRERISRRVATIRSGVLVCAPVPTPDSELLPALLGLLDHHTNTHSTVVPATLTALAADGRYLAGDIDDAVRRISPPAPPIDWTPLLGHIDAVVRRAINARTPETERLALVALLTTWVAQPFAVPGEWRIGRWERTEPSTLERTLLRGGSFVQPADIAPPADATEVRTVSITRDDASRIERLLDLLSQHGPRTPSEKAVRHFVELTGVREPIARLALDGMPRRCGFGGGLASLHDAHDKMVRTKPYRANSAVAEQYEHFSRQLDWAGRHRLLAAGVPEDVSELWTDDGDLAAAERMAAVWNELLGRQLYVSEELIIELEASTGLSGSFALALAHPQHTTIATKDLRCHLRVNRHGWLDLYHGDTSAAYLRQWNPFRGPATALAWALTERPVADPDSGGIDELHDRLRARWHAPSLLVGIHSEYFSAELFGPDTFTVTPRDRIVYDNGLIVVDAHEWHRSTFLRPAALADPDTVARSLHVCADHGLTELTHAIRCEETLVTGLSRLVDRAATTPVAAGHYEADPRHSVPELVERVSAAIGASPDAAALYLQLLTLARPTDRAVRRFNNWTPTRHKKAQAELVARRLVVEDKRARAGRTAFIPGPWTAKMTPPHLPLETAKLDRHLVRIDDKDIIGPYAVLLPPRPLHEMFEDAWFSRNT